MATGLFALLDDIAALMDDTAVMTKVAAQKTAGIVGDDLAVNAEAMVGINPKRELAIVAAVAKGSLINKAILIPAALLLAAIAPPVITYGLMLGGAFLCYEAFHKTFGQHDTAHETALIAAAHTGTEETLDVERQKIRQAITTDFILSAEIVAIALGSMAAAPLAAQALSLTMIGLGMTVIVYGAVAGLVKIDDAGLWLLQRKAAAAQKTGRALVASVPYIMKTLSVVGTTAMFVVGGGIILLHITPFVWALMVTTGDLPPLLRDALQAFVVPLAGGVIIGGICSLAWKHAQAPVSRLWTRLKNLLPIKS